VNPLPQEPSGARKGAGRLSHFLGRSQRGVLLVVGALTASLLGALGAYAGVIPRGPGPEPAAQGNPPAAGKVRLAGHAAGLFPGSVQSLRVRVENAGSRPVTVRSVRALVGDASRRCQARNVRVSTYRGRLRLAPHRRRWVRLRIAMRPDAANACQRARFPLAYRASLGR
jgi:hypothetical protein